MHEMAQMLVERLEKKGWIATEEDGKIVMSHPDLVSDYSIAEAVKMQERIEL